MYRDTINKLNAEFKEILKRLLYSLLSGFATSLGVALFIMLLYFLLPLISNDIKRPLIKILANEIGVSDPYIVNIVKKDIEQFLKDHDKWDDFKLALISISMDQYHERLQSNLVEIKGELDDSLYIAVKNLYFDLSIFLAKLHNGVYGLDTAKAFTEYYEIIEKHKCKLSSFREKISTLAVKKFSNEKEAQNYFKTYYIFPIETLVFEIHLRTFSTNPEEVYNTISSITNDNFGVSIGLLDSDNTCK
jgi:hypothetical protein